MKIRDERPEDAVAIAMTTTSAFRHVAHAAGNEARIVAALRCSGALAVSLVAMQDGDVAGHIAFSPVRISEVGGAQSDRWYALGPVSVRPDCQRQGIGAALVREGLSKLELLGAQGCVLLGEPAYYGRFGFISSHGLTYLGFVTPHLQCLAFGAEFPRGSVVFDPAFDVQ